MDIVSILGERLESYSYDPSGQVMRATSTNRYLKTFYRYNAEGYDPKTGSVYLRARYYNTRTGSFNTKDTYIGNLMEPLNLNRYSYVQGNAVCYQDPSGHDIVADIDNVKVINNNSLCSDSQEKAYGTMTILISGNATALVGVSIAIGVSFDLDGNIAKKIIDNFHDKGMEHEIYTFFKPIMEEVKVPSV